MISTQVSNFLLRKSRKARPTYEQYRFVLEKVLLPWCEEAGITETSQLDATAVMILTEDLGKRERPLSPTTIQTYIRNVRIFLNWCQVPQGDYEPVRVPRRMRDTLTRTEIERIENAASTESDKLIVRILADTGIRVSELTGLRPQDLRADTNARHYFLRVIGKGDKEREVGLTQEIYRRVRAFSLDQPEFIFNLKGKRMEKYQVEYRIRKLSAKAKIGRQVNPHLFRHSFITQQIRAGKASLIDIQRAVGHSTLAMISQVYAHTTPADSYSALMAGLQ